MFAHVIRIFMGNDSALPPSAAAAVLVESEPIDEDALIVKGLSRWEEKSIPLDIFCNSLITSGFQATAIGKAAEEILKMLKWRPTANDLVAEDTRVKSYSDRCQIWLSFTSNMISSGLRELFVFLAKHKLVDVIVTSAGGVEEDFIKCLAHTYVGDFSLKGSHLREKGWNRIGNLLVPNSNYCAFEDWVQPLLDECLDVQIKNNVNWTPSKLIEFLGQKINDETSLYYWCAKNKIPVFCPGITDGSLGDNLFFHTYRSSDHLRVDVVEDIRRINDLAMKAPKSGLVILGGGIAKHHTCNANLMRNGADFAVYINTAQEFDGCDSGARPDEAVSWGKIRATADPIKVYCDATIAFPLVAIQSFHRYWSDLSK